MVLVHEGPLPSRAATAARRRPAYGVEAQLLTPAQFRERVPWIDERRILGGVYTPPWTWSALSTAERSAAGRGPSIGKHLLLAYLPLERAVRGTHLAVEHIGEQYPVTDAAVGATPVFDPGNERMRA